MTVADLEALRDGILADLIADLSSPFDSYSIDGQSVNRSRWRQWAIDTLFKLNELLQAMDPYEIRTAVL